MSLYHINLGCLPPPTYEVGKGFSGLYTEAQHDIETFGGDLDYWGRGYANLSTEQVIYLEKKYDDPETGQGIVGIELESLPEEGEMRMPNGHIRRYYR